MTQIRIVFTIHYHTVTSPHSRNRGYHAKEPALTTPLEHRYILSATFRYQFLPHLGCEAVGAPVAEPMAYACASDRPIS